MTYATESEYRKAFYLYGKRLFSYPIASESADMQQATIDQLAYEQGCHPSEIGIFLEECAPKRWDFSRDCWYEHVGTKHGLDQWRILSIVTGHIFTFIGPLYEFIEKYEAGEAETQSNAKNSSTRPTASSPAPQPIGSGTMLQRFHHSKRTALNLAS